MEWGMHSNLSALFTPRLLTVRGDTFKVVGQAEGREGAVAYELVVQRVAEEHPFGPLGRRFRIISARFRDP